MNSGFTSQLRADKPGQVNSGFDAAKKSTDAQRAKGIGADAVMRSRGLMEGARAVQAQRAAAKARA